MIMSYVRRTIEERARGKAELNLVDTRSAADPEYWQQIMEGIIIVAAVSVDIRKSLRRR
ncbi:hypothetical protein [Sorangium sp. So ce861]|uniref:hypothetical protein n=1 Tax=Sorangium sp. So ce861 TaxID=3133323 RepID=UPI003F5F78F2